MKKWFEIKNKADKAEIWIYEQIGEDWWSGEGTTAKTFQKELSQISSSQIDLHINSPGGEVFDGITIYNLLKQHPANVTTYIDGLAASIASVIALAGDEVIMAANALFMIHNPWGMAMGDADEMRKTADLLDKVRDSIVVAYEDKCKKSKKDISDLMSAETWMSADDALEKGFIDQVADKMDMAACVKFLPVMKSAKFRHIPENLSGDKQTPTAREAEKALRDVGFTQIQAKAILAGGLKGEQRDVDPVTNQRDVVAPTTVKNDRIADLLTRAEILAPTQP